MKSILVIDTPKSCRECPLFKSEYNSYTLEHFMMCKVNGKLNIGKDYATKCHPQCSLQDTTELLEALEVLKRNYNRATQIISSHEIDGEVIVFPTLYTNYNKLHKALGGTEWSK